jgi:hypothetical protein
MDLPYNIADDTGTKGMLEVNLTADKEALQRTLNMLYNGVFVLYRYGRYRYQAGLWIRIESGFSDFVDPYPYWESRSRIRIQGQEN